MWVQLPFTTTLPIFEQQRTRLSPSIPRNFEVPERLSRTSGHSIHHLAGEISGLASMIWVTCPLKTLRYSCEKTNILELSSPWLPWGPHHSSRHDIHYNMFNIIWQRQIADGTASTKTMCRWHTTRIFNVSPLYKRLFNPLCSHILWFTTLGLQKSYQYTALSISHSLSWRTVLVFRLVVCTPGWLSIPYFLFPYVQQTTNRIDNDVFSGRVLWGWGLIG